MKKLLLALFFAAGLMLSLHSPARAETSSTTAACQGLPGGCSAEPATDVKNNVEFVITLFSWIVGIASVFMIILGGFRFVTSGGDSGKVSSSRNTVLYAIVGLIVVAVAQIIVRFVLTRASQ